VTDGQVIGHVRWTGVTPTTLLGVTVVTLAKHQKKSPAVVVVAVVMVVVVEGEVATEAAMTTVIRPGSPGTDRGPRPGDSVAVDMVAADMVAVVVAGM